MRKGLWAESDKGEKDFQLALKHYIEALKECDDLEMDKLSDEYTGIQLKIGEMYERLSMTDEANFIYNEIATLYLKTLTDESIQLSELTRNHLIQKDLRVVIKLVELNKLNLNLSKAIIITHSILPIHVLETKLGEKLNQLTVDDLDTPRAANKRNAIQFLPFLDEYINMVNLLIAINITLGDYNYSINLNLNLNKLMLLVNYPSDKVLLNQCNLGSLLYLQSEMFELNMINILKKYDLDFKNTRLDSYLTDSKMSEADTAKFVSFHRDFKNCIQLAIDAYENVNKIVNNLQHSRQHQETDENQEEINTIQELVALSTYSLGVIHLHLGDYTKSERFLRESRVKSKSCNYVDLITEIENELNKLFKEKTKNQAIEQ